MNQAEQQVELVKQEAARLIAGGVRLKEIETENKFADTVRQTELQMQTMEENLQLRVNNMHEQMKEDYVLGSALQR